METKIMQVFYGADGLPYKDKELQVHYPIVGGKEFTGASNTTEIRFYVDNLGGLSLTWVANAVLPNGIAGSKILSSNHDEDGNYVYLQLSNWYTQVKGDLYISLQGYFGGVNYTYDNETGIYTIYGTPTIQATGLVKINISYATPFVGGGEEENITLQQLMGLIAETKNEGLTVVSSIALADISEYPVGHLFYCMSTRQYYMKTALDNTYEQYTMLPYLDNIAEINFALGTGNKIYGTSGYVCIDSTNGLKVNNKLMANQEWVIDYVQTQIDTESKEVFVMTSNPMDLTEEQFVELRDNDNLRIVYTYGSKTFLFSKERKNSGNHVYTTQFREDEVLTDASGRQYTQIKYMGISLDLTYERLGAAYVLAKDFYNKDQADTLFNLKADKSDTYTKAQVDAKLTSMLVYKGTQTVAQLNALVSTLGENNTGWFYNISDDGVLTWTESGTSKTLEVFAGDNVCWTGSGWDKLTMDLSAYDDKFIAAGFFEVQNYNESTGEITFVYSSDLYTMSYDTDTGVLTIEAN